MQARLSFIDCWRMCIFYQQRSIILTVKMFSLQNNQPETIFTVESLDLNFNKKKQRKSSTQLLSNTDRKYSITKPLPETLKTDRSVLMEKKKNYSDAIRERNLNLLAKKKGEQPVANCTLIQNNSQKALFEIKQNVNTEPNRDIKDGYHTLKRHQKSNCKRLTGKKSLASLTVLDFQAIPFFHETLSTEPHKIETNQQIVFSPRIGEAKKGLCSPKRQTSRLQICPKIVNEQIMVLDSDATLLMKQNATFKRDLATFRKENSVLRKQLQQAKDHIQEMQEKARVLLESSVVKSIKLSIEPEDIPADVSNRQEIIQKLRAEISQLKSLNSGLELKAYMAQKKVVEQVATCKKKMAKELHEWRDKCTKLRAENMKFKSFRDVTISMEISKDQQ